MNWKQILALGLSIALIVSVTGIATFLYNFSKTVC